MSEHENPERNRLEAQLSLSSEAPESLDERIRVRRARGDRVTLPVPGVGGRPGPWRGALVPTAIAAAAALAILAVREWRSQRAERNPPVVTGDADTGIRDVPRTDSLIAPRPRDQAAPITGPQARPRDARAGFDDPDGLYPAGTLFVAMLTEWRESAVDSAARVADRQASAIVEIGYSGEGITAAPRARALADSITRALERRGVPRARMSVRVGPAPLGEPPLPQGVVKIVVRAREN